MKHPETYLLEKIIASPENGLSTLGKLNGCHVPDIGNVMREYAADAIDEFIKELNTGAAVNVNGKIYQNKIKK